MSIIPDEEKLLEKCEKENDKNCRICKGAALQQGPLISPCHCKGSVGYVHINCLQRWLQTASRTNCEICNYHFQMLETRKYTLAQGIQQWLRPQHRRYQLRADLCNICFLTIIITLIILICLLKMENATTRGEKNGVSKVWTRWIIGLFLAVISLSYVYAVGYLMKKNLVPFCLWWRSAYCVQLELRDHSLRRQTSTSSGLEDIPEITILTAPIQIVLS